MKQKQWKEETRWERFKEIGFGLASVGVGGATVGVFLLMWIKGAVYVYENIPWILYTEIVIAILYEIWAIERFIKDLYAKTH